MQFVHPGRYLPPKSKQPKDYDIGFTGYEMDESCPMYGALFVSPWQEKSIQIQKRLSSMTTYIGTAIGFRGFSRTPDLLIQLVIGHGLRGQWPPLPGIAVITKKTELSHHQQVHRPPMRYILITLSPPNTACSRRACFAPRAADAGVRARHERHALPSQYVSASENGDCPRYPFPGLGVLSMLA